MQKSMSSLCIIASIVMFSEGFVTKAWADTPTETSLVTVGIMAGGLSLTEPTMSGPFTVSSSSQTNAYSNLSSMTLTDATGSGDGWNIKVSASPVTVVTAQNNSSPTALPYGSLELTMPTVSTRNALYPSPSLIVSGENLAIDVPGSFVTVAEAGPHSGMGRWTFAFPVDCLHLTLGSRALELLNAYHSPMTFTTTLTWRVSSGP